MLKLLQMTNKSQKLTILLIFSLFVLTTVYWYFVIYRSTQKQKTNWDDVESVTMVNENFSYSIDYPKSWGDFPGFKKGEMTKAIAFDGASLSGFSVLLFDQVNFEESQYRHVLPKMQIEVARYETDENYMVGAASRKSTKEKHPDWNIDKSLEVYDRVTRNNTIYFFRDDKKFIYEITCIESLADIGYCDKYIKSFKFID